VLYPMGITGEVLTIWGALPIIQATRPYTWVMPNAWNFPFDYYYFCLLALASYIPGSPKLYGYMLDARRKVLGGGNNSQGKAKAA